MAEFERSLISERTRAGIAAARSRGKVIRRPAKLTSSDIDDALILLQARKHLSEVAQLLAVSPLTLQRSIIRQQFKSA